MTVSYIPGAYNSFELPLGKQLGIFAKHGIDLDLVSAASAPLVLTTVLSGSAQAGDSVNPQSLGAAIQHGESLAFFCGETPHAGGALDELPSASIPTTEAAGSIANAVKGLKGATIGVPAVGGAAASLVEGALASEGLPSSDYTLVSVGTGATATGALQSGRVKVLFTYPFFQQNLEAPGAVKQIVDLTKMPAYENGYAGGLVGTRSWIQSHKTLAQEFCSAVQGSIQAISSPANKATVDTLLGTYGVKAAAVAPALTVLTTDLSTDISAESLNSAYEADQKAGLLATTPPVSYASTVINVGS